MLSNHPGRPAPQAASPRNLCVLCVSALDSSSLGLTFNLQLSTFNRVSFLSSHLSLSQRSSKSFTIRTSMAPLPQPLYNPHLQTPLGSAGNKGLITPLESALTRNSPVTPVESALTKRWGVGFFPRVQHSDIPIWFPFIPFIFTPFQTLLHFFAPIRNSTLLFSCNSKLFAKNTRGWEGQFDAYPSLPSARVESRSQLPLRLRLRELCVLRGLCDNSDSLLRAPLPRATEHTSHCHPRGRECYHQSETRDIPL